MPEQIPQISGLAAWGFKSLATRQVLDIRPLTVLAGANSSGKSSLIQPLLLLKQTLEAQGDPGTLLLDGPNVRFTSTDQILSRCIEQSRRTSFGVEIRLSTGESLEVEYIRRRQSGRAQEVFDISEMRFREKPGGDLIRVRTEMSGQEIAKVLPEGLKELGKALQKEAGYHWVVKRNRCFLFFVLRPRSESSPTKVFAVLQASPADLFIPVVTGLIHLPGHRGNPLRTYKKATAERRFPGVFQDYVAGLITKWEEEGRPELAQLAEMLRVLGLSWKIESRPVDATQVELVVGRLQRSRRGGARDVVNIADTGFGVSQVLPVLVALLAASPGQLVYIEQPEIHLHPAAQRGLARLLCKAAARGIVLVVETHSAIVVRTVQTIVASGEISPEDVALYWFKRDEGGCTQVIKGQLDADGAYGDWPEDFSSVELEVEGGYLDTVEARQSRSK